MKKMRSSKTSLTTSGSAASKSSSLSSASLSSSTSLMLLSTLSTSEQTGASRGMRCRQQHFQYRNRLSWNWNQMLIVAMLACIYLLGHVSGERDFNFNDSHVPVLEPKDVPAYKQDPYVTELSRCQHSDEELMLSLLLQKHDWHDMTEAQRFKLLEKLSQFFAIPKELITLDSVSKHDLNEMQKTAIHKGNNKALNLSKKKRLGRISFALGCGSTYFSMGEPIVKQIGHQIKDGSLNNIAGANFGYWITWRKTLKSRSQRLRRQAEGSGGNDDDYDYEYDDDEIIETSTEVPTPPTHAHRHHHGVSSDITDTNQSVASASAANVATPASNNLDEEIVESVSQLESVISKTIENTKNIKELLVLGTDDMAVEEDDVAELERLPAVEVPVAEIDKDLERTNNMLDELVTVPNPLSTSTITANNNNNNIRTQMDNIDDVDIIVDESELNNGETILQNQNKNKNLLVGTSDGGVGSGGVIELTTMPTATTNRMVNLDLLDTHASSSNANHHAAAISTTTTTTTVTNNNEQINIEQTTTPTTTTQLHTSLTSATTSLISPSSSSSSSSSLATQQQPFSPYDASSSVSVSASASPSASASATFESETESASSATATTSSKITTIDSYFTSKTIATTTTPPTTVDTTTTKMSQSTSQSHSFKDENDLTNGSAINSIDSSSSTVQPLDTNDLHKNHSAPPSIESSTVLPASSSAAPTSTTADMASSTYTFTDFSEPRVENTPPMIKSRLQKFAVKSGKAFSFIVPKETFYDAEDQTNLRLELTDKDGLELKPNAWLQFNADKHELYGLPLDDAVSRWQYRLTATDSGNESVTEAVEISVQQHRGVRAVNHEINVAVKINEKTDHSIDWQLKLLESIASTLGDATSNAIVVREIRQAPQDLLTATLVYFNETLPTSECPENELNNIVRRLDASLLNDLVQPTLGVKSITGQLIGTCQKTELAKPKPTSHMTKNYPPMLRNHVDRVNATVGHLLVFKVPSDTFYDDNDLTLTLKTKERTEINPRHWLQFDSKNQEFYGIPKSGDIGSEEYLLVAEDNGGLTATDALVVVVNHAPKKEFSVFFKAYLAIRHENFNADLQRKFVERIAQLHGDPNTSQIQVRSITTHHDSDSTIVNFYNTTLHKSHNLCPEQEIIATGSVYLINDHTLRDRVKKYLGPELNITNLTVIPFGTCHQQIDITHHEYIPAKNDETTLKSSFDEQFVITFILPAVIIVSMIFAAAIIVCCLHRRRHKSGKMELGDEDERKSLGPKTPVIFEDEMGEKPEIGNKSPIILKDEKPPLLPPSYNTSNMNGDNDVDEYVPPPAVVVGGREARGKSPATPSYRKPPPYVSP